MINRKEPGLALLVHVTRIGPNMASHRYSPWLFLVIGVAIGRLGEVPQGRGDVVATREPFAGAGTTSIVPVRPDELFPPAQIPTADRAPEQTFGTVAETLPAPQGPKPATNATRLAQQALRDRLDLADRQDFDDAQRGFIAPLPNEGVVRDAEGRVVWNLADSAVARLDQECPETVNPSLWRQAQLLGISGLFQVSDRIYQVRGLDLANVTFIEGDTGLIVIDPLLSTETARVALDLYYAHRPRVPVVSVIITHCHPDHFGGIAGVITEEAVANGQVSIISPQHFLDEVISENVLAGNVMQRRAGYMYGSLLPKGPRGDVGNGLGLGASKGTTSLITPTDTITQTGETRHIDGLTFEFQLTPGSEAPAEMHLYVPELKALCPAENATHTMHNLYTLRGAKVRDARAWAGYLQQTIDLFGDRTEVLFAPHHWPVWGQERIVNHLTLQRDLYKFIHDQTLRLANRGYNMTECAELIELPPELERHWGNRGYYGTLNHNIKAVWNFYLGWFDGHPARLHPLPPADAGARYVEYMGGIDRVLERARVSFENGEYRWVAQVLDNVVSSHPHHVAARELQADALEQLGYQAESGSWRNFYLSGAQELRDGIRDSELTTTASSQAMAALPLPAIFDSLAVRLNSRAALDMKLAINFQFTDTEEEYLLTMQDGVLNHFAGRQDADADCTVAVTRSAFNQILEGRSSFTKQIFTGNASLSGSSSKLIQFFRPVEPFEPWFDVMLPRPRDSLSDATQQ